MIDRNITDTKISTEQSKPRAYRILWLPSFSSFSSVHGVVIHSCDSRITVGLADAGLSVPWFVASPVSAGRAHGAAAFVTAWSCEGKLPKSKRPHGPEQC
jgi:hypothetical protein